eukprot:8489259-Pyramimonas_sp.AAC.1
MTGCRALRGRRRLASLEACLGWFCRAQGLPHRPSSPPSSTSSTTGVNPELPRGPSGEHHITMGIHKGGGDQSVSLDPSASDSRTPADAAAAPLPTFSIPSSSWLEH